MKTRMKRFLALLFLLGLPAALCSADASKPNILLIVADDLGFSDLACYGGDMATPNLDALAKGGLRFTQFYNTARCWPSRAAILTGYYAQQVRRDTVPGVRSGTAGTRPAWARLLPEMLRPLGYRSYHSGKWHVDGKPLQNGFDHSYSLNDHDRHFAPRSHTEDDVALPAVKPDSGYYSTTAIAEHAIKWLKEHAEKNAGQPFFEFVAFTSPHFPVQAPLEDIARYRDRYLRGWDVMRDERWQRMHEMGIGGSALSAIERDVGPPYSFPDAIAKLGPNEVNRPLPWSQLNAAQRKFQADKMAVHAAMVDRMDREIGRVLAQIRAMGAMENTIVFFLSDNGASAEMMVRGDGHDPDAICGTGATFLSIGPGWSSMANTPFRRHKTWVHEGGISTPLIVNWPRGIAARGELRHTPGHLIDLVPTILDLAGGKRLETWEGRPVPPAPGKSLVPLFTKDGSVTRDSFWWLHEGNRALRMGNWKIVAAGQNNPWELYDLTSDRSESKDLAAVKPEKVRELAERWTRQTEEYTALARQDLPSAYQGWKHSGSMYLTTTPDGANLPASASVDAFPLLVRLRKDFFNFSDAKTHGDDLRFSSSTGTPLAYQIDEWDAASGTASIWVRIPNIKGNARQEIKLHRGNADAATESSGSAVFNGSNGYLRRDLSPLLLGKTKESPREAHYYFAGYNLQAVRQGPWKLALAPQNETMGKGIAPDATGKEPRLYNLDEDIGERSDVADKHPDVVGKLAALAAKMGTEIGGTQPAARRPPGVVANPAMLYLSDDTAPAAKPAALDLLKPGDTIDSAAVPQISKRPFTISCVVETAQRDAIILAHGGLSAGYALHLKAGRVVFVVRTGGGDSFAEITAPGEIAGPAHITAALAADATMTLTINDQPAVTGKARSLIPRQPAEDFCLGLDNGKPVATYTANENFKGSIHELKISSP